eukprot:m.509785 g.509785  ORF g.509785 m.509785 type:complete len:1988 (-) comp21889_c0_seq22:1623-7586(-)
MSTGVNMACRIPKHVARFGHQKLSHDKSCSRSARGRIHQLFVQLGRPDQTLHMSAGAARRQRRPPSAGSSGLNMRHRRLHSDPNPEVAIGDVSKPLHIPSRKVAVPVNYLNSSSLESQATLRNLRWMLQKDILGQDMFLLGAPGPARRRLALQYCELTNRDHEYLALSRDTTEADLKQRREIRGGRTEYFDQCAVRAAVEGRVLILEGIEKAERNVLPVLNNLLENREMQLEDGRFLVAPHRYDELLQQHSPAEMKASNYVRVDERFRIIALGLPVPRYPGNPLDPPLRSRFQAREIRDAGHAAVVERLSAVAPHVAPDRLKDIAAFYSTIKELSEGVLTDGSRASYMGSEAQIPEISSLGIEHVCKLLNHASPNATEFAPLLHLVYPYTITHNDNNIRVVEDTLARFGLSAGDTAMPGAGGKSSAKSSAKTSRSSLKNTWGGLFGTGELATATPVTLPRLATPTHHGEEGAMVAPAHFDGGTEPLSLPVGALATPTHASAHPAGDSFVPTELQTQTLRNMMLSHSSADLCLIGPRGVGKTVLVEQFARQLGYAIRPVLLHKDMSSRDLLQQRTMESNGDTTWKLSPLVLAALDGSLAVLDGIHRTDPTTVAVLQRLAQDRELVLHDGTHLMGAARFDACMRLYNLTPAEMAAQGLRRIHPAFRMVAVGEPSRADGGKPWLSEEITSMFDIHVVAPLSLADNRRIVETACPRLSPAHADALFRVGAAARDTVARDSDSLMASAVDLSTRQLLRIARRLERYPGDGVGEAVHKACLSAFFPPMAKETLATLLESCDVNASAAPDLGRLRIETVTEAAEARQYLQIGDVRAPILKPEETNALRVPKIRFYDNPQHTQAMQDMLKDFVLGEHLLLVGNQGVGKNKIVDRMLQLLNKPREYIQLHRDTTVQTLTQQPSVEDGRIVFTPSPLVRAIEQGSVLVVDEADKAPTHVTCILKSLVESTDMTLADGRRIVPHDYAAVPGVDDEAELLRAHPDFRLIVLANRPGFPFLGNDFYGSIGDVFGCHAVVNPTMESELSMLAKYGPNVDPRILTKLVHGFGELRRMSDEGKISYPFSVRELVNIVTHLERYPEEGLANVVRNVFDFDSYDKDMRRVIVDALRKHGIPIGAAASDVHLAPESPLPEAVSMEVWSKESAATTCHVESQALRSTEPLPMPLSFDVLNRHDGRADVFGELQFTVKSPFFEFQRMLNTDVGTDGQVFGIATRPIQLFSFSLGNESDANIMAMDLEDLFPRYYGAMSLDVAAMGPALPNTAVVFDPDSARLLLSNVAAGTVQELHLPIEGVTSRSQARPPSSSSADTTWKMCTNLADGGELVLFEQGGERIVHVDLVLNTVSTVTLPHARQGLATVHTPFRGHWILTTGSDPQSKHMFALTAEDPDANAVPSVLRRIAVAPEAHRTGLAAPPTHVALQSTSGDPTTRAVTAPGYYGGAAQGLGDTLRATSGGQETVVSAHPRGQATPSPLRTTHVAAHNTFVTAHQSTANAAAGDDDDAVAECAQLEVVDLARQQLRHVGVPCRVLQEPGRSWAGGITHKPATLVGLHACPDGTTLTADSAGDFHVWELDVASLQTSMQTWRQMIGTGVLGASAQGSRLSAEYKNIQGRKEFERYSGLGNTAPKHGKEDPKNEPHVGGNTWAGGTGGRDTAGLGGKGGPYRLDKGHDVHQLSDEEKDAVPQEVKDAARAMGQKAFAEKLKEINMSDYDAKVYDSISHVVQQEVKGLKHILKGLEAKGDERVWIKNQSDGDLDDGRIIDGLTGERNIYKRRGTEEPFHGKMQQHPKRLTFVVDVSGSMYRFNGHDQRLERMLQAVCLVMESFAAAEPGKFTYDIIGHSGESHNLEFVQSDSPPTNNHDRLKVLQNMYAHSQFCMSGDNTLKATAHAIETLSQREDADERFVIVLSDANLDRYGIHPRELGLALTKSPNTQAFCIMIGSLGEQAEHLRTTLPRGRSFVCMNTEELPAILKRIFTDVLLR